MRHSRRVWQAGAPSLPRRVSLTRRAFALRRYCEPCRTIKNSWGTDWGFNGYILMGRGSSFGVKGLCGIQMDSSYPTA